MDDNRLDILWRAFIYCPSHNFSGEREDCQINVDGDFFEARIGFQAQNLRSLRIDGKDLAFEAIVKEIFDQDISGFFGV